MGADYLKLEEAARAATPGPWMLDGMGEDEPEINYWAHRFIGSAYPLSGGNHEIIATSEDGHGPNAAYIAAADPSTILALVAEVAQVRRLHEVATERTVQLAAVIEQARAVTDAEVKAAAGAMPCRWSPRDHEHPVGDDCRDERMGCLTVARRALEAAAAIREARS